ncbi:hypothetical protein ACWDXH_16205 [Micromonospora chokoriensis]
MSVPDTEGSRALAGPGVTATVDMANTVATAVVASRRHGATPAV